MTEPFAQCSFELDKKLFYSGNKLVNSDIMGKTLRKMTAALILLWLGISAYTLLTGGGIVYALSELGVVIAFELLIAVWIPRRRAKSAWKAMEMSGKADALRSMNFYGDRLEIECQGEVTEIDYGDVSKVLRGDKLTVLITNSKKAIIIKEDSFITGSCEELPAKIKESGGLKI